MSDPKKHHGLTSEDLDKLRKVDPFSPDRTSRELRELLNRRTTPTPLITFESTITITDYRP